MLKDLVVKLSVGAPRDIVAHYAISTAQAFGAHLVGIAFAYDLIAPPDLMAGMPSAFIEEQRLDIEKIAKLAISRFEDASRRAGVSAESRMLNANLVSASEVFGRITRRFDLAIVGQAEPNKVAPEEMIIEAALFQSGRPVIVVPNIHEHGLKLDRVIACWDGSRAATRAIADAMPFLERAKTIDVIIVANEAAKSDELPGADIGQHLARHGLAMNIERIAASDTDVPGAILSYAAKVSADLIVMGGYGHSRLWEFVLGGATRGILTSTTVPTLMSH
jgi:nucleotide-binding universal stress UspA family protein